MSAQTASAAASRAQRGSRCVVLSAGGLFYSTPCIQSFPHKVREKHLSEHYEKQSFASNTREKHNERSQ